MSTNIINHLTYPNGWLFLTSGAHGVTSCKSVGWCLGSVLDYILIQLSMYHVLVRNAEKLHKAAELCYDLAPFSLVQFLILIHFQYTQDSLGELFRLPSWLWDPSLVAPPAALRPALAYLSAYMEAWGYRYGIFLAGQLAFAPCCESHSISYPTYPTQPFERCYRP
jgi:hypothetical protein